MSEVKTKNLLTLGTTLFMIGNLLFVSHSMICRCSAQIVQYGEAKKGFRNERILSVVCLWCPRFRSGLWISSEAFCLQALVVISVVAGKSPGQLRLGGPA